MELIFPIKNNLTILALGAESAGNFSILKNNSLYFSKDFGDLLKERNWGTYKKMVLDYLKDKKIKPDIILSDLHPLFNTTIWGQKLARDYKARHIQIQHHFAHIFSAIGDRLIQDSKYKLSETIYGIVCDGTGYGMDEKIWGGEVFQIKSSKLKVNNIGRIGYLENQTLLGGDLAIREPARVLISILSKFLDKEIIYRYVKKYYLCNEFELLYNQLQQKFNCEDTSSTGRILDAISLLLGFCGNVRKYKHEPIDLLEKNSGEPYANLKPRIVKGANEEYILDTTYLFNYVINYLHKNKDKKRLAATAQLYIAKGFHKIIKKNIPDTNHQLPDFYMAGGIANNKIIFEYLESRSVYASKKIPRGDAGLSFGQIFYYLLANSRD